MNYINNIVAAHCVLVASGCEPLTHVGPNIYYHSSIDLMFCYGPSLDNCTSLNDCHIPTDIECELVVVVPSKFMPVPKDYPYEVIRLEDVAEFILYRAFSPECNDHRLAIDAMRDTCGELDDADDALEAAEAAFKQATNALEAADAAHNQAVDARIASKAPRFQPVALALALAA